VLSLSLCFAKNFLAKAALFNFARGLAKIMTVILAIITIAFILWICFRTAPEPIPRDVIILIGGGMHTDNTILSVNGNIFEVIAFRSVHSWNIDNGIFNIEGYEILDETFLDDFSESSTWRKISITSGDYTKVNVILDRWSMELSEEQLNDIWIKIGAVVDNYKEPPRLNATGWFTHTNAVIDGNLYRGEFYWDEYFRSFNFKFPRRYRNTFDNTDMNLVKLTLHLSDLAPISLRW